MGWAAHPIGGGLQHKARGLLSERPQSTDDTTGLLPEGLVGELLARLRDGHEPAATHALVELSDVLSGHRRNTSVGLAAVDDAALALVGAAVEELDGVLAARMDRPPIHLSASADWAPDRFVSPAVDFRPTSGHWKPLDVLWTTPAVDTTQSDWSIWAAHTTEIPPPQLMVSFNRFPASQVSLIASLAQADKIVVRNGSVAAALKSLHARGTWVIDFSWRCVLEAEISAFRGRRGAFAFPCGLDTACSLWLEMPRAVTSVQAPPRSAPDDLPARWFTYGGP